MAMLGSGPFTNSSGSGYYTVEDYRRILRRAAARHVEIVPEFDMPSHSHAAIKSMERRYHRLNNHPDGLCFHAYMLLLLFLWLVVNFSN